MLQEILGHIAENGNILLSLCIFIGEGAPIDAPCLPPCPGRTVAVPLAGSPMVWLPSFHIEKEGMPSRIIFPDHIFNCRVDMLLCNLPVFIVPCLFGGPVQQREVQQAVNNQPVILRRVHWTPCLDKLTHWMEPAYQLVRRFYCRFLPLLAPN